MTVDFNFRAVGPCDARPNAPESLLLWCYLSVLALAGRRSTRACTSDVRAVWGTCDVGDGLAEPARGLRSRGGTSESVALWTGHWICVEC